MELKRYVEIVWKRKWILIVTAIIVPLCAYLMMLVIPPIYKSETELWITMNTLQQKYFKEIPDTMAKLQFITNDNAIGTMEEILNNSESINRVITELGLTDRKGEKFTPDQFTNPYKISLIFHLQTKGYSEEQVTDADVIKITAYSTKPAEAYAIADRVVKGFVSTFNEMYRRPAESAKKVLLKRLKDTESRLLEATTALERFRTKYGAYNISNQISTLMLEKSTLMSEKDKAIRNWEGAKIDLRDIKNASLIRHDIKDAIVKIETSQLLDNYKNQLLNFEAEEAKLSVEKTGEHPDIKIHKQEIALVKDRIRQEIAKSFSSQVTGRDSFFDKISGQYLTALFTSIESSVLIKSLDQQINEREKALGKLPELDRVYSDLQSNIDSLKTTQNVLKADYEAALSGDSLELSNTFVIQPPTLFEKDKNNQYFPPKSKKVTVVVATFLGLFFGFFLVFFIEYWNSSDIRNSGNDAKKTDLDEKAVKI
jgi:uncharacterized protein involved in exopolysaccharide biosynthesis